MDSKLGKAGRIGFQHKCLGKVQRQDLLQGCHALLGSYGLDAQSGEAGGIGFLCNHPDISPIAPIDHRRRQVVLVAHIMGIGIFKRTGRRIVRLASGIHKGCGGGKEDQKIESFLL